MNVEDIRVSPGWLALREPADAAARAPDLVEQLAATPPAGRAPGRSTTSAAAPGRWAAGSRRCCPGRSTGSCTTATPTCWRSPPPDLPARPPTAPRSPSRRGSPTSPGCGPDDLAGATPHHRLGAARHADRGRAGRLVAVCGRRRLSRAADPVRRRPRRAGPGGSARRPRGRRVRRPPAPHDAGGAACSARMPSRAPSRGSAGWGPRSWSGPAPGASAPARPTWRRSGSPAGSVPRASSRPSWPPRPTPTHAGVWRRRQPDSSPSPWTTPICWSCPDERRTGR